MSSASAGAGRPAGVSSAPTGGAPAAVGSVSDGVVEVSVSAEGAASVDEPSGASTRDTRDRERRRLLVASREDCHGETV